MRFKWRSLPSLIGFQCLSRPNHGRLHVRSECFIRIMTRRIRRTQGTGVDMPSSPFRSVWALIFLRDKVGTIFIYHRPSLSLLLKLDHSLSNPISITFKCECLLVGMTAYRFCHVQRLDREPGWLRLVPKPNCKQTERDSASGIRRNCSHRRSCRGPC